MIEDVIRQCDFKLNGTADYRHPMTLGEVKDVRSIARKITNAENEVKSIVNGQSSMVIGKNGMSPVLGITGTGGAGKSSV
ncbi:hypothetical protein ABTF60_18940, partial [Acinetobacter baumannii]